MVVTIRPPSPPPAALTRDATSSNDDDVMDLEDEFATSSKHNIVTPGETITTDPQWMRGHGTYVPAESSSIIATVAGTLHKTNKLLSVVPLRARYQPEIGDLVVGRIVGVQTKKWTVDIAAPMLASLPLSSINLPGGILRRRTAVDELNIRTFFQEHDLLVAEVQQLHGDGTAALHTRSLQFGKLRNGMFTSLKEAGGGILANKGGVVRSRRQVFTLQTAAGEIDVILGVNGYIWVCKHTITDAPAARDNFTRLEESVTENLYSSENDEMSYALRREINRVSTLIRGMARCGEVVAEDRVVAVYEAAMEMEAEEQMLPDKGESTRARDCKTLVQNCLLRIEVGG